MSYLLNVLSLFLILFFVLGIKLTILDGSFSLEYSCSTKSFLNDMSNLVLSHVKWSYVPMERNLKV